MEKKSSKTKMETTGGILAAVVIIFFCFTNMGEAQKMNNPETALSPRQSGIATVAAFTAVGDLDNLQLALNEALDAGLTVNEIKEVLVQMYAYCGFPRSLNGINIFMTVMEERAQKGIRDETGPEAPVMPADLNRDEYGANVRMQLTGMTEIPPPSGYQLFVPIIDTFLKEHLFADIFYRDNLDFLDREIATVSALASMRGTTSQLQSHIGMAMNMGLTENQMYALIAIITERVDKTQGEIAAETLARVLNNRK